MLTARPAPTNRTDAQLLQDSSTDPEAFGEFFDRHYDGVLRYFTARVRSRHTAADLCAETLASALEGAPRFDPSRGSASQWMYGIAHHKLTRFWRELRVARDAQDRLGMSSIPADLAAEAAFETVEVDTDREQLVNALSQLPPDQASAVRLRVLEELDYTDIARRLNCRTGAARVRVHRGLKRLATELGAL